MNKGDQPVTFQQLMDDTNSSTKVGALDQDDIVPQKPIQYSHRTDDDLASERAKSDVRTHAELAADKIAELPIGMGLSFRMPAAGQCENDQFPFTTDKFGKQRR